MSQGATRTFSVGLLAAVALAIIAVGVFLVGDEQRFWGGRTAYRLHFSRTNGLLEGAPVALNGVTVGSVVRMRFSPDPVDVYVDVKIAVASSVAPRIRGDTVGKIQTLGLLGDKYIELNAGSLSEQPIDPGALIRSLDPVDYESLVSQSGDIVTNAIEVTALLRQVLTDINNGEGLIGRLVSDHEFGQQFAGNLSRTVANLESSTARIEALMADDSSAAEIIENMLEVSRQARHFSEHLNEGRGLVARLTSDEELADRTLANLESATMSISQVAAQVRSGEGSLGRLVYDDSLYENADTLVGGGSGGFWRLLGRGAAFFWPFGGGSKAPPAPAN